MFKLQAKKGFIPLVIRLRRTTTGFSMIESLVAITILVIAIAGPLTLASRGIFASQVAKDEVVAFYLTQEALEAVRAIRDGNRLESLTTSWLEGLNGSPGPLCIADSLNPDIKCTIDALDLSVVECVGGTCPRLQQDPVSGLYGYGPGFVDTIYTREIQITRSNLNPDHEIEIKSTVSWVRGFPKEGVDPPPPAKDIILQVRLYDW